MKVVVFRTFLFEGIKHQQESYIFTCSFDIWNNTHTITNIVKFGIWTNQSVKSVWRDKDQEDSLSPNSGGDNMAEGDDLPRQLLKFWLVQRLLSLFRFIGLKIYILAIFLTLLQFLIIIYHQLLLVGINYNRQLYLNMYLKSNFRASHFHTKPSNFSNIQTIRKSHS